MNYGIDRENPPRRARAPKKSGVKVTVYLTEDIVDETDTEKERLRRSTSWLLKQAWQLAKEEIKAFPTVNR
jgi:uncharacterized small protein (TIGR04563 family)